MISVCVAAASQNAASTKLDWSTQLHLLHLHTCSAFINSYTTFTTLHLHTRSAFINSYTTFTTLHLHTRPLSTRTLHLHTRSAFINSYTTRPTQQQQQQQLAFIKRRARINSKLLRKGERELRPYISEILRSFCWTLWPRNGLGLLKKRDTQIEFQLIIMMLPFPSRNCHVATRYVYGLLVTLRG